MKNKFRFLVPNKKVAIAFVLLSVIMGLASLQGEGFSENEPSTLYRMLSWITGPAWEMWLYISVPVLYFFGVVPQSGIRFHYFDSWELVYGLNFIYYYFASSAIVHVCSVIRTYLGKDRR